PDALKNSDEVRTFHSDDWTIKVLRLRKQFDQEARTDPVLVKSWEFYTRRFIVDGRVVDTKTEWSTTSEGQSYAMLRAVYIDDRPTFDRVWSWTKGNLQVRGDGLFSWHWGDRGDGTSGVLDANSATDADEDIA